MLASHRKRARYMIAPIIAILLLTLLPEVNGLIEHLSIRHDRRSAYHIGSFGYDTGGVLKLEVNNLERLVPDGTPMKDTYEIAFVLQRSSSDAPVRISSSSTTSGKATTKKWGKVTTMVPPETTGEEPVEKVEAGMFPILDECFHSSSHGDNGEDIIIQLSSRSNWKHFVYEHVVNEPGFLHVYFSNCEPMTSVSYDLDLIEYNLDADGTKMYLSAGERYLPTLLAVLASCFMVELIVWTIYLKRHSEHVKTIHYLMLACVLIKAASVALAAMKYHSLKSNGVHDGWIYAFYVVSLLKSMFVFCVIVLLSTGWSYLKPFLTERDRYILMATIIIQALVNAAAVVVGELQQGDKSWVTWHDILSLLDMACWCLILVPIVWSIRSLRQAATDDLNKDEVGAAGRSMQRLQAFRSFYLLVIGFIYFTRIVVFLLSLTLPFELVWLSSAFAESASLLFYALTGYLFRPITANPYSVLESTEDEMQTLREDEEMDAELDQQTTEIQLTTTDAQKAVP